MTLEQRVEALENAIANMTVQQKTTDEMSEAMRKIASAFRPGGVLNAARKQAANGSYNLKLGIRSCVIP